jgi:uncharacterized membrane protein
MTYRIAFLSFPTIVPARRFRIVPAPSLVLGAMLFVACQDPVAPPAARPALVGSLSERGESRSERTFDFTTIDVPNAVLTTAWGINARGDIVGSYTDGTGRSHGYLLRDGEFTTIDFSASARTEARAIGPKGEIVGVYWFAGEPAVNLHGYLRTKKGAFVPVNDPPHINTVAQRILPDGTILGCRHGIDVMATMRGIIISREGSIAELDVYGSMENGATPDRRRIVGLYTNMAAANRTEGFLIDDGEFTPLLVPGSDLTQAWDINPAGEEIIGFYRTAGVFHGFVLRDEQYITLDVPGATATRIRGINSRGDIVGTYVATNGTTHGFLASQAHED